MLNINYHSTLTIVDELKIELDPLHEYKNEISKLLDKIKFEREYTKVPASTLSTAKNYLWSIINDSANKYAPIIRMYQAKLNDILTLERKTISNVDRNVVQDRLDDATTDSSIRKFNDTPNAGNNPDLLDNTYLSESERNTTNLGERSSNMNEDLTEEGTILIEDNIERAKILAEINIANVYHEWLTFVDRNSLVVVF